MAGANNHYIKTGYPQRAQRNTEKSKSINPFDPGFLCGHRCSLWINGLFFLLRYDHAKSCLFMEFANECVFARIQRTKKNDAFAMPIDGFFPV